MNNKMIEQMYKRIQIKTQTFVDNDQAIIVTLFRSSWRAWRGESIN